MDPETPNGHTPARIAFGDKEWESMQPEVASMLLKLWKKRAPSQFGAYLAEVFTGTKPKAARGE